MLQDYMAIDLPPALERQKQQWWTEHLKAPESRLDAPVLAKLGCFLSAHESIVERAMVDRVLAELGELGATRRRRVVGSPAACIIPVFGSISSITGAPMPLDVVHALSHGQELYHA
jgi:hypothetical protein